MVRQAQKNVGLPKLTERFKGRNVMEILRKLGLHFDVGKSKSTLKELLELDGLFQLKDIQDRIPIPDRRLKTLIYDKGEYGSCFFSLYKGSNNRGSVHVDLKRLCHLLHLEFESSEPLTPDLLEDT